MADVTFIILISRGRNHHNKKTSGTYEWANEEPRQPFEAVQDARNTNDSSQASAQSTQEKVRNGNGQKPGKKVLFLHYSTVAYYNFQLSDDLIISEA